MQFQVAADKKIPEELEGVIVNHYVMFALIPM